MHKRRLRIIEQKLKTIGINRKIAVLSTARMADAFCNSLLIVLLPLYVIQIPKSPFVMRFPEETLIGFLVSLSGLMVAVMQPVAATISDRTGRRKPFIVAGLAVVVVATLCFIGAGSYRALVGFRILQGVGIAFTIPTALTLIADYADRASVGGSMGFFTTGRLIGFALGPLAGGLLMKTVSFEAAFIAGALGALSSLILVVIFVPEVRFEPRPPRRKVFENSTGWVPDNVLTEVNLDRWGNERKLVRWVNRQLYVLGSAIFVMAVSISLIAAVEPELNRRLSQTALGFGLAFSMSTFARIVFQIPIGRLSDRIGRKSLIFLGLVMLAPLSVLQGMAPTTFWLSADRFLLGAATAMIVAPAYAMVADRGLPGLQVRQMGIMTMAFGLGVAAGPLLSGTMAGVVSFETPFLVSGALSALAAFMVYVFVEESHQGRSAD